MGYGEVGGGGSVHWVVVPGGGMVCHGVDPNPAKGNGNYGGAKFRIRVNGKDIGEWAIENNPSQIQIFWPPHDPGNFNADANSTVVDLRNANKALRGESAS